MRIMICAGICGDLGTVSNRQILGLPLDEKCKCDMCSDVETTDEEEAYYLSQCLNRMYCENCAKIRGYAGETEDDNMEYDDED